MEIKDKSFRISLISTVAFFVLLFSILFIVTPFTPRYLLIFNKRFKVPNRLFDIKDYKSEYVLEEDPILHTGYSLITDKDWLSYKAVQGMRAWIRVNVELERISDLSIKSPEQTLKDGVGDRNDMALLLVNMIYVISGQKVDLVLIKENDSKSDFPMYYLYYQDVVYEVLNTDSYRNRQILEHIPFDKLFSK